MAACSLSPPLPLKNVINSFTLPGMCMRHLRTVFALTHLLTFNKHFIVLKLLSLLLLLLLLSLLFSIYYYYHFIIIILLLSLLFLLLHRINIKLSMTNYEVLAKNLKLLSLNCFYKDFSKSWKEIDIVANNHIANFGKRLKLWPVIISWILERG